MFFGPSRRLASSGICGPCLWRFWRKDNHRRDRLAQFAICRKDHLALRRSARMDRTSTAGRRVWVTGASTGIGRAVVVEYARRGALVAASARDGSALKQLAGEG